MSKKVVVFGGAGFLGSYLVNELLRFNYRVVAADIVLSEFIPKETYVHCDISNKDQVEKVLEGASVVFNLAGVAALDDAIANPLLTVQLNIVGNLNILEAAKNAKVDRFVYASSAYALSEKGSFYGISKLTSEKIIEEYQKKFGLDFTIIRYGSIYGDRDVQNNYIYNLVKEAMLSGQIDHPGDGEEVREYIHAADVAKLAASTAFDEAFIGEHIILTGMERIKRKELFMIINEMLPSDIEIKLKKDGYANHYKVTPYSFHPTLSKKVVPNPFIDLGQGILDCMQDIHEKNELY